MMEQIWQNYFNTHPDAVPAFRGDAEVTNVCRAPAETTAMPLPARLSLSPESDPWQEVRSVTPASIPGSGAGLTHLLVNIQSSSGRRLLITSSLGAKPME